MKLSVKLPAPAVMGLKVFPETPVPDQLPFTPETLVGRFTGAALEQKGPMGDGIGLVAVVMETIMVVEVAHWPAFGVKVAEMVLPP